MKYLLDTNVCIAVLRDRQSLATLRLAAHFKSDIVLCSIVKAELFYGIYKSGRLQRDWPHLYSFFSQFASLPFDDAAAEIAGRLRAHLSSAGTSIGPNDLLIAAVALANNLTLVTHNTYEFSCVPGLTLEDWEAT